jgi:hypothetical protein
MSDWKEVAKFAVAALVAFLLLSQVGAAQEVSAGERIFMRRFPAGVLGYSFRVEIREDAASYYRGLVAHPEEIEIGSMPLGGIFLREAYAPGEIEGRSPIWFEGSAHIGDVTSIDVSLSVMILQDGDRVHTWMSLSMGGEDSMPGLLEIAVAVFEGRDAPRGILGPLDYLPDREEIPPIYEMMKEEFVMGA